MKISQFRFENFDNMPNHEKRTHLKFTTFCVDCQILYKCDIDAKCCKFLKTYFALFVLSDERYYYKKDSSSSTMSFTNLTMKTELNKSLQHFAFNVKLYKNVISTQNVVNFWRHILPYLYFLMKDIITKKTVQIRWCHLQGKPRKQNSLKVYNILRYKFLWHILSYSSFPFALFVLSDERYYYKKDSSSSTMSFTNLTMKTELNKSLQHFAFNVKLYKNVISTQNVVNFWRHILPYLYFLMKDIITKKTVQIRWCHLQAKKRKKNSLKVYHILRWLSNFIQMWYWRKML